MGNFHTRARARYESEAAPSRNPPLEIVDWFMEPWSLENQSSAPAPEIVPARLKPRKVDKIELLELFGSDQASFSMAMDSLCDVLDLYDADDTDIGSDGEFQRATNRITIKHQAAWKSALDVIERCQRKQLPQARFERGVRALLTAWKREFEEDKRKSALPEAFDRLQRLAVWPLYEN